MNYRIFTPFRKNNVDYTIVYCESPMRMNLFIQQDDIDRQELEKEHGDNLIFFTTYENINVTWAKDGLPPVTPEDIINIKFPA